jgi:hypothetical protein
MVTFTGTEMFMVALKSRMTATARFVAFIGGEGVIVQLETPGAAVVARRSAARSGAALSGPPLDPGSSVKMRSDAAIATYAARTSGAPRGRY